MFRQSRVFRKIFNQREYQQSFRSVRSAHTASAHSSARPRIGLKIVTGGLILLGLSPLYLPHLHGDDDTEDDVLPDAPRPLFKTLLRSYFVYSMCSIPSLVDASPRILEGLSSVPGIKQLTEAFVRVTFFDHFVGGDTATDAIPLLHELRAQNKGALFAYSVEVDEHEATSKARKAGDQVQVDADVPHKRIIDEMVHCIDVAADYEDGLNADLEAVATGKEFGRKTWVAVKITALLPRAQSLINLSSHILRYRTHGIPFPGTPVSSDIDILYHNNFGSSSFESSLTKEDIKDLRSLHADLERICERAQRRGVKVIIDAEYSWYQPALEAFTLALMRKFNKLPDRSSSTQSVQVQPLVYGTYQAYLRRTPQHLIHSLSDAKAHSYALGVKLVRGAYHPHELAAYQASLNDKPSLSISPDNFPPVWETKKDTDTCYNSCVNMLIHAIRDDIKITSNATEGSPSKWRHWSGLLSNSMSQSKDSKREVKLPRIGVLFGTHNWESARLILDELVKNGLAVEQIRNGKPGRLIVGEEATERVAIGQLYGMSDDLTDWLVGRVKSKSPFVIKYVPYGALAEVMPYLSRRAIENKSVLGDGGATRERKRAGKEIWRRVTGG